MSDLPQQFLSEGRLDLALAELQAQIRQHPADVELRLFLFQLLVVKADWERALKQLSVCAELDAQCLPMVQVYQQAIRCELLRASVFKGDTTPMFLGEPDYWMALMVEALKCFANGQMDLAVSLKEQAFEQAPAVSGVINGEAFAWFCDSDNRLGPILELIIHGKYYWVSSDCLSSMHFESPVNLRDTVWLPVQLNLSNGGQMLGLMPSRYPVGETGMDDLCLLARKTEWQQSNDDYVTAIGQKTFTTDLGDIALFEIRDIDFNEESSQTVGQADGEEI